MELEFQKLKFHKKVPLTWIIWIKKCHKELEFKKLESLEFYKLEYLYTYFKFRKEYFNCLALEIQLHFAQTSQHKKRDADHVKG